MQQQDFKDAAIWLQERLMHIRPQGLRQAAREQEAWKVSRAIGLRSNPRGLSRDCAGSDLGKPRGPTWADKG